MVHATVIELRPMPSSRGADVEADATYATFFEDGQGRRIPHPAHGDAIRLEDARWVEKGMQGRVYMVDRVEWGAVPMASPPPYPTRIVALRLS